MGQHITSVQRGLIYVLRGITCVLRGTTCVLRSSSSYYDGLFPKRLEPILKFCAYSTHTPRILKSYSGVAGKAMGHMLAFAHTAFLVLRHFTLSYDVRLLYYDVLWHAATRTTSYYDYLYYLILRRARLEDNIDSVIRCSVL